ncbi:MAG: hypothetical protein QNJ19_14135 [Woeseiaceae bacterium]|nr:hypothetical protein [Woeseiaceae bacterium]
MEITHYNRLLIAVIASAGLVAPACAQSTCPPGPKPKLKVGEYQLALTNTSAFCVKKNGSFKIRIVDGQSPITIGDGTIKVRGKPTNDPNAPTIEGDSEAGEDKIRVKVSDAGFVGQEYRFYIEVVGVGKLDPRVRIVTPSVLRRHAYNLGVYAIEDELGFDALGLETDDPDEKPGIEALIQQVERDKEEKPD